MITVAVIKALLEKVNITFFKKPMDWNTTNIAGDIFFIPTKDIHKNNTWSGKNADI